MLQRVLEARGEIIAVVNALLVALGQFGFDLGPEQQTALQTLVNVLLILGAKLMARAPTVPPAHE